MTRPMTRQEFLEALRANGSSVRQWAEHNGFSPDNVRQVLYSPTVPRRGERYRIARTIGLIPDPPPLPSVKSAAPSTTLSTQ